MKKPTTTPPPPPPPPPPKSQKEKTLDEIRDALGDGSIREFLFIALTQNAEGEYVHKSVGFATTANGAMMLAAIAKNLP